MRVSEKNVQGEWVGIPVVCRSVGVGHQVKINKCITSVKRVPYIRAVQGSSEGTELTWSTA